MYINTICIHIYIQYTTYIYIHAVYLYIVTRDLVQDFISARYGWAQVSCSGAANKAHGWLEIGANFVPTTGHLRLCGLLGWTMDTGTVVDASDRLPPGHRNLWHLQEAIAKGCGGSDGQAPGSRPEKTIAWKTHDWSQKEGGNGCICTGFPWWTWCKEISLWSPQPHWKLMQLVQLGRFPRLAVLATLCSWCASSS